MEIIRRAIEKTKRILFTIRFSIFTIFIALFTTTAFLIIYLSYISFSHDASYTALSHMKSVSDEIYLELNNKIESIARIEKLSSSLINNDIIDRSQSSLLNYTYYLVNTIPFIQGSYWGDENGNFIYSERQSNGSIRSEIFKRNPLSVEHFILNRDVQGHIINRKFSTIDLFDPRKRPWYIEAKSKRSDNWSKPYQFYPSHEMGISISTPVFDHQNKFIGAFGLDVKLDYLSQFLTNLNISARGFAFIINTQQDLVAYSKKKALTDIIGEPNAMINTSQLFVPLIEQSIGYYKKSSLTQFSILDKNNEEYLVTYRKIPKLAHRNWFIGVIAPKHDFTLALKKVYWITLIISLITLMTGILIVSKLITHIVKPLSALVKETEDIKKFHLDGKVNITSRIKEIFYLNQSIKTMKNGLRQFERYVPKTLVHQLIESGEDLRVGGARKELAILFTDIENFTTIAEKADPYQLTLQLCEYFEALSEIMSIEKGTIDKYIGDSIMVFWGAPLPTDEPCSRAARSALKCQHKIAQLNVTWKKQGKHCFQTRIGIHFGEAIVGNLGSSERLNYTAFGDTINIGSRLEQINKEYHTKIMVSDAVYEKIKNDFILKKIDCVSLKGRIDSISIYELLASQLPNSNTNEIMADEISTPS